MGTHPNFESDFDCLTEMLSSRIFRLQTVVAKRSVSNLTKLANQDKILRNRFGIDIIDLDKSRMLLILALNFLGHVAIRGGSILFATDKFNAKGYVQNAAFECGEYSVTNFNLDNLIDEQKNFVPDCIFVIGANGPRPGELPPVLVWAAEHNIPTCGLVDTDCNPSLISYPIPGNDDDSAAADLLLEWAAKVVNEGKQIRNSVSKLYAAHDSSQMHKDGRSIRDKTIKAVEMDLVSAIRKTFEMREQLVQEHRVKEAERAEKAEIESKNIKNEVETKKKEKLERESAIDDLLDF